jgi:hypothetical protein
VRSFIEARAGLPTRRNDDYCILLIVHGAFGFEAHHEPREGEALKPLISPYPVKIAFTYSDGNLRA